MSIHYKTRGNSNPQGKQKVYFTCHPDDFERFFEEISGKILGMQNCAIWYYDKDEHNQPTASDLNDLDHMKLFVIPITSKFLSEPNHALDKEFAFAISHHIPVLPIMMESGLDSLFMSKCGSLQYLDPNVVDNTALSFDDKLAFFLNSVLIADDMVEKIRSAFDAYVFLSYRKKDRQYAKELMQLIHSNPYYRDIAIWYDEFLTPGQDFNDEISTALSKSQLFALLITPSILEKDAASGEPNYVARVEYPMAVSAGKEIIPVEMIGTDHAELKALFPHIADIIVSGADSSLNESLFRAVKKLAIAPNDSSPEHNFFIGLAYLSGIDVEVNHATAVKLITSAAENNYEPAMLKLVQMYQHGDGVSFDYNEAIKWRKRIVTVAEASFRQAGTIDSFENLINALWYLGHDSNENGDRAEAETALKKAAVLCDEHAAFTQVYKIRDLMAECYEMLGGILISNKEYDEAKKYIFKCFEITNKQATDNPTYANVKHALAASLGLINLMINMSELTLARSFCESSIKVGLTLTEAVEKNTDTLTSLHSAYQLMGAICLLQNDSAAGVKYHVKALNTAKEISEIDTSSFSINLLARSYSALGNVYQKQNCFGDAVKCYTEGLALAATLLKAAPATETKRLAAEFAGNLGDLFLSQRDFDKANGYLEQKLAFDYSLTQQTGTPDAKRDLLVTYDKLGDIAEELKNYEKARRYYELGLEIALGMSLDNPNPDVQNLLATSYEKLGSVLESLGQPDAALSYCEKALEIREEQMRITPSSVIKHNIVSSLSRLGVIAVALHDHASAQKYFQKGLTAAAELDAERPTVESKRDLFIMHYYLGLLFESEKKYTAAREEFEKSTQIINAIVRTSPTKQHMYDMEQASKAYTRAIQEELNSLIGQ